mmetsp:Transcript_87693/g.174037  ORF Transcript_87693/g.174037 Transcript_87693/m.174037 type:complete len:569 (+) Transcript_87693:119-1825(+)
MFSILAGVRGYMDEVAGKVCGMKVLMLDDETVGIISMVSSQNEILGQDIYLVERIDAHQEGDMRHLIAVCLIRPTNQNFMLLSQELCSPRYKEYHLFFTNVVSHSRLEQLASCDEFELVKQVHEVFADVYAVDHDLFSLNLPSTIRLTDDRARWTTYEEAITDRIVEGLLAACIALRMVPAIRYTAAADITRQVAKKVQARLLEERSLFGTVNSSPADESVSVMLIVDRRSDPVSPLLNQWTYQAMLHELLSIDNNRIDMSKVPGIRVELREIVMSATQDKFFEEHRLSNFGDLGMSIKGYVEDFQNQTKSTTRVESVEEMQRFVDEYPEFRRLSGNVSKHVAVVHELSRIVEVNGLLEASQLEQELACSESRHEHFRAVVDLICGPSITHLERLRLVMLYALRYEHDSSIAQLKDHLHSQGVGLEQIRLIDQILRYGGSHVRGGDLFHKKSLFTQVKHTVANSIKGVQNVYTQHKTYLASTVESLCKGRLKESSYPFLEGCRCDPLPQRLLVFVVGGTTYEEARDVAELNKPSDGGRERNWKIVLGGTTIHNSHSFLADLAQLSHPE